MLILLLPACGYPSYYPTPDYVADTSDMDTSAGMPCGATWSFDAVELRYVDNSGGPGLMLHSVQEDCSEWVIGPVSQREVGSYPTNPGAVFAARTSTGELYAWTQVPFGEAIWPWSIE